MILKERDNTHQDHLDKRRQYGARQEQDVAFYLRRKFASHSRVFVINDLRFCHNGDYAQIDHLVVHRFGFVLIESKSIYGEVRVNNDGEWSRSYQGKWQGMASPLQQLTLQQEALKGLLTDNADRMLIKLLGLQTYFGGRQWDKLCVVSSSALLHRYKMPKEISKQVVKNEFLGEKVDELCGDSLLKGLLKSKPAFSRKEMQAITDFLLSVHEPQPAQAEEQPPAPPPLPLSELTVVPPPAPVDNPMLASVSNVVHMPFSGAIQCKRCGERSDLIGAWGQYGYYVICQSCQTKTSMRGPCPRCNSPKNRIRKRGGIYTRHCTACGCESTVLREEVSA